MPETSSHVLKSMRCSNLYYDGMGFKTLGTLSVLDLKIYHFRTVW